MPSGGYITNNNTAVIVEIGGESELSNNISSEIEQTKPRVRPKSSSVGPKRNDKTPRRRPASSSTGKSTTNRSWLREKDRKIPGTNKLPVEDVSYLFNPASILTEADNNSSSPIDTKRLSKVKKFHRPLKKNAAAAREYSSKTLACEVLTNNQDMDRNTESQRLPPPVVEPKRILEPPNTPPPMSDRPVENNNNNDADDSSDKGGRDNAWAERIAKRFQQQRRGR